MYSCDCTNIIKKMSLFCLKIFKVYNYIQHTVSIKTHVRKYSIIYIDVQEQNMFGIEVKV